MGTLRLLDFSILLVTSNQLEFMRFCDLVSESEIKLGHGCRYFYLAYLIMSLVDIGQKDYSS